VNAELDAAVARNETIIAAYASAHDRPDFSNVNGLLA
jgi:hypothetical protein